jgi:prepilin-type N-terminal cleavage/methylation domain-containing protein
MKPATNNFARRRAFSLLEVMIAIAIFFLAAFAILNLVSSSLANARRLQRPLVDAGPVLAAYVATNSSVVEGTVSGSLSEYLGKKYDGYSYTLESVEVETNHLYKVECMVQPNGSREIISDLTTLLYAPHSPPGSLDGGNFIHK